VKDHRRRSVTGLIAAGAAIVALGISVGSASASERVQDGGFDAATCTPGPTGECTSPAWTQTRSNTFTGPICRVGTANCGFFPGPDVGPRSPSNWAQFGGESVTGGTQSSVLEQIIQIPAGPATLTFYLKTGDSSISTGTFQAKIDGTQVFSAGGTTPGYANYSPVTVDVGGFAGGARTLSFEWVNQHGSSMGSSDSFNIDDVSLDAADAPPAPGPEPDPGPGPDPGPDPGPAPPPTCKRAVATIPGTDSAELLQGTSGADVIAALGGNDIVRGGGGNDIVCGGRGKDELRGQGGDDRLYGDNGKDKLSGGGGGDRCNGGTGNDTAAAGCERTRDI
jgi:Ca2+-binding RTX toxin-like protein